MQDDGAPVVALVGRPNVGKSSLFNRVVGQRRAVVDSQAGVTRDPLFAEADWAGRSFVLQDTGGIVQGAELLDPMAAAVSAQALHTAADASVIILVVDGRSGVLPDDLRLADRLRRLHRPVVVWVNKSEGQPELAYAFYQLGLGEPHSVSAIHGDGLGDALDRVVRLLPAEDAVARATPNDAVRVAVVGRPNAGKSSLVNQLLGRDRLIVSSLPGTTRDAVDVPFTMGGADFVLVDTPGMRRPGRVERASLEWITARRSITAVQRAEVSVLLLDATEPATEQDQRIGGRIADRGRAVVIGLNKVDLLPPDQVERVAASVREAFPFLGYAEVVCTSTVTRAGLDRLMQAVLAAATAFRGRIPTAQINACIHHAVAMRPPASLRGRTTRILFATQVHSSPPTIVLMVTHAHVLSDSYLKYLENQMRSTFSLQGTPVRMVVRERPHRAMAMRARAIGHS